MSDKSFAGFSLEECNLYYKSLYKNSEEKWNDSQILASGGSYGTAVSMAIISTEELMKSLIVFLDTIGFKFRKVKGINKIFRDHQIRYFTAYLIFAMSVFGEDLLKLIEIARLNPQRFLIFYTKFESNDALMERYMTIYISRLLRKLILEFDWFSKIDKTRQNGFYCDMTEVSSSPSEFSEDDFKQLSTRLVKIRHISHSMINQLSDKEFQNQLTNSIKRLNKGGIYPFVEQMLSSLRKSNGDVFSVIKEEFNERT